MSAAEILELERIGLALWPPQERAAFDGWELAWTPGATRRTRSVYPFAAGTLELDDKLSRCRRLYARRGGRLLLKLTSAPEHAELTRALASRGWARAGETTVLVRRGLAVSGGSVHSEVSLEPAPSPAWLRACERLNDVADRDRAALRGIQARVPTPRAYAAIADSGGAPVAQGMGCVDPASGWLFVGEVATDPTRRRRGLARRVVQALVGWGREQGAHRAFLQVVAGNGPAEALYAQLGFRERYRYAYHAPPHTSS